MTGDGRRRQGYREGLSGAEYQASRLESKARFFDELAEDDPATAANATEAALMARVQAARLRRGERS